MADSKTGVDESGASCSSRKEGSERRRGRRRWRRKKRGEIPFKEQTLIHRSDARNREFLLISSTSVRNP